MGKKVLFIDIDPQSNLSESFGLKRIKPSIYESFVDELPRPVPITAAMT
jgi:cellulose biosynthesis protein BcsQ